MGPRSYSPSRLPSVSACSSDFCRLFGMRSHGTWTRSEAGLSSIASVHAGPSRGGRAALLVTQTALATMALIGGGLLVHSFVKLANVDPGYDATHLLTFTVRSSSSAWLGPFLRGGRRAPSRAAGREGRRIRGAPADGALSYRRPAGSGATDAGRHTTATRTDRHANRQS